MPARWRSLAALVFGATIVGLSPILVRLAEAGPAAVGFWRLAFAIPILFTLSRRANPSPTQPSQTALLAGLFFALDLGFWHYGIRYTSVANATVLSNLAPVVVIALGWVFLRERPRKLLVAAVGAAVGGAWMMSQSRGVATLLDQSLGDALSASTALWYGLYFLFMSRARRGEPAARLMLWSSLAGAPLLLAAAAVLHEDLTPVTIIGWLACAGLGLMHVTGQGAVAWALGRVPAPAASVAMLLQPIVAGGLGWILFDEAIGRLQGLGAVITLSGVALAQAVSRPAAQPPEKP